MSLKDKMITIIMIGDQRYAINCWVVIIILFYILDISKIVIIIYCYINLL